MKCPKCGLENSVLAVRCDCGYEFSKGAVPKKSLEEQARELREQYEKSRKLTENKPEGVTLKKRSVLLMILFSALTLGFYFPFWFLTRRESLNRLSRGKEISFGMCIAILVMASLSLLLFTGTGQQLPSYMLDVGTWITTLVLSFRVKDILNDTLLKHRKEQAPIFLAPQEEVAGIFTFFFTIFYLQYKINRLSARVDNSLADSEKSATLSKSLEGQAQAMRETAIDEIRVDSDLQPDIGGEPNSKAETAKKATSGRKSYPVKFTGKTGEYFKIWVVNTFLTILTLGVYSAWAKVRKRQYFYRSTFLLDTPFDYLAEPKKILKGRLIILGTLIILIVAGSVEPMLLLILAIPAILLFPWLVVKALAFRARNSSYRSIRFDFRGTYREAFRVFILQTFVTVLTLGFGYPYQRYQQTKFVFENGGYGRTPFRLRLSDSGRFYSVYLWQVAGVGILLGITTQIVVAIGRGLFPVAIFPAFEQLLSLLSGLTLVAFLRAAGWNLVWSNVYLYGGGKTSSAYFQSTLSIPSMIWIYLSNGIAIVFSLGLLIPWASIRTVRYRLSNLLVSSSDVLESVVASEQENVGAAGEEIIGFFDFDVGL